MQVNSIEVNKMLHVQHSCIVSIMIITYVILHTTSLEFIYFTYYRIRIKETCRAKADTSYRNMV